ncbi:MAG: alcohol dehydrogenase catalytic domain-containing protein [Caldilineaceae bacterium]
MRSTRRRLVVMVKLAAAICHSDIHYMESAWGGVLPAVWARPPAWSPTWKTGVTLAQPGDHVVVTLIRSCRRCYFCTQGQPHLCEASMPIDANGRLHTKDGRTILAAMRCGAFAESVVVHESPDCARPARDAAGERLAAGLRRDHRAGAVVNTAHVPPGSSVVVIGAGGRRAQQRAGGAPGRRPAHHCAGPGRKQAGRGHKFWRHPHHQSPHRGRAEPGAGTDRQCGADFVFITAGSSRAIEQGATLMRNGGTLVIVGIPATGIKLELEAANFANDSQRVLGSKMGSTRLSVDIPKLVELYHEGRLKLDELITKSAIRWRRSTRPLRRSIAKALRNVIIF